MIKKIDKNKIIEQLKKDGFQPGSSINYETLQELCRKYGEGLNEKDFAIRILGCSSGMFYYCKNSGNRLRILKTKKIRLTEEQKKEIIEDLIKAGYEENQSIDYAELKKMCEVYGRGLGEREFAIEILKLTTNYYSRCKNYGKKAVILKKEYIELKKEEKKEILEEIAIAGYKQNQLIYYEEMKKMCKLYGRGMGEEQFTIEILGGIQYNYIRCKDEGKPIKLWKNNVLELTEKEKMEIIKKIKDAGYGTDQLLYNDEIKKLHEIFGKGLGEKQFIIDVLGCSQSSYYNYKNKHCRIKIWNEKKSKKKNEELKEKDILIEDKSLEYNEIIEELEKVGYKKEQSVNYEQIKKMCKEFGRGLSEREFANKILGCSKQNFNNCKNRGTRIKIWRDKIIEITEKEKKEIIEELKKVGYEENQALSYEEIKAICKAYGRGLGEKQFATEILGCRENNFNNCKNRGIKTKIWRKGKIEITEEFRIEILENLRNAGYINGQSLSYNDIKKLNSEFGRGLGIKQFVIEILGGTESSFYQCRRGVSKTILRNGLHVERINEISSRYLIETRFYSKDYIEQICKEYNITTDDFIRYVILKRRLKEDIELFSLALNRNNGLWIGKMRMSEDFVNKNINAMNDMVMTISKKICIKYKKFNKIDDYAQDLIIHMINNLGTLEKNLGDTDEWIEIARRILTQRCLFIAFTDFFVKPRTYSFTRNKDGEKYEYDPADENAKVEDIAVETTIDSEFGWEQFYESIELIKKYVKDGKDKLTALKLVQEEMNTNAEVLLKYMKLYELKYAKKIESNSTIDQEDSR